MKCNSCQYRAVSVVGTQRQIIARYKAAWDACYKCARSALNDKTRFAKLCVAAQADKFKHRCLPGGPAMMDNECPMCDLEYEADLIATAAAKIAKRGGRRA